MDLLFELSNVVTYSKMYELQPMIEYFNKTGYPDFVVNLDQCSKITPDNAQKFVESSMSWLIAHPENKTFLPYYEALLKYKSKVENARSILGRI